MKDPEVVFAPTFAAYCLTGEIKERVLETVLFVDDEPEVLDGLRRVLRTQRGKWEMEFVSSGEEALKKLEEKPTDVVVTDMRMPGMNGAELLNCVAQKYPRIIRIVLSGQSDRKLILQCSESTHQFVYKPCEESMLIDIVTRAVALRDMLSSPRLLEIVSGIKKLPTRPSYYNEISALLEQENVQISQISEIISGDISMCAKVLQLANSAAFALRSTLTNIETAIQLLGIDNLRSMVLMAEVFNNFEARTQALSLEALWNHSSRVGKRALQAAKNKGCTKAVCDESFAAGILHDTGRLVLAAALPRDFIESVNLAEARKISEVEAERAVLKVSHMEIGAYLLGLWGLPNRVVEALAYHHEPWVCSCRKIAPLALVALANAEDNLRTGADETADLARLTSYAEECELAGEFDLTPPDSN